MDEKKSPQELSFNVQEACVYGLGAASVLEVLRQHSTNETEKYYDVELPVELGSLDILIPWSDQNEVRLIIQKLHVKGLVSITGEAGRRLRVSKAKRPLLIDNPANYMALMRWVMYLDVDAQAKLAMISLANHAFEDLEITEAGLREARHCCESHELSFGDFREQLSRLAELGVIKLLIWGGVRICFEMGR